MTSNIQSIELPLLSRGCRFLEPIVVTNAYISDEMAVGDVETVRLADFGVEEIGVEF